LLRTAASAASGRQKEKEIKIMKKVLYVILTVMCLFALAGCGGTKKADAPAPKQAAAEKVLRVGTDSDYPPFGYYQEATKTFIGFDIELMQGVARQMGYSRVEFVDLEFNNLLPSLQDGQVDAVIACMTITDERKKAADFTDPYLVSSNVAVSASGTEARSVDAMKDKRIAVEVGSIHAKQAKQYSGNVIACSNAEEALKMVLDKKADYAIMDNYTARFFITNYFNGKLSVMAELPDDTHTNIGIAVAKGNKEMVEKLNAGLRDYQNLAAYYQMKKSYFGKMDS
jgi:polar amino acid transport system substrate-binding protein